MQKAEVSSGNSNDSIKDLKPVKIILPIILGLAVVFLLFYRNFNYEDLQAIKWAPSTIFYVLLAIAFVGGRHLFYMWRLRTLTEQKLSWWKTFEVVSIWEFSSSATPTMVGGTAVGLFVLIKEKIKSGEASTIIMSTIFLDSLFFLFSTALAWLYFGDLLLSPVSDSASGVSGISVAWRYIFISAFTLMAGYTVLVGLGLFYKPTAIAAFLDKVTSIGFLKRWNKGARQLGSDFVAASVGLRKKSLWNFWMKGFLATWGAWSCRFIVVICLIVAVINLRESVFVHTLGEINQYVLLYARQLVLYLILVVSPTPGGAGVAEGAFPAFYSDFIPARSIAVAIGMIWRWLTFYPYLILGAIVVPHWLKGKFGEKKVKSEVGEA